jgi:hypothetical protein
MRTSPETKLRGTSSDAAQADAREGDVKRHDLKTGGIQNKVPVEQQDVGLCCNPSHDKRKRLASKTECEPFVISKSTGR